MKRGAVIGIAAAAVAVLVAGGGLAWWLIPRPASAEDAARAYLVALSTGDFTAIAAMTAAPVDGDAERILSAAFAGAEYLANPEIVQIAEANGSTRVQASAEFAGQRRNVPFVLENVDGRWMLVGDHLASLEVTPVLAGATDPLGDSTWVGDALVPAATPLALLPAVYQIEAAPRVLVSGSDSVAVSTDEAAVVDLQVAVTPEATVAAQERLNAYADACTTPATTVPANCGLRVPWAADLAALAGIAFRVDERPVLELSPDGRTFAATGGIVVATATGTTRDGSAGSFTYRADDWALRGTLSFSGDEMVLAVG